MSPRAGPHVYWAVRVAAKECWSHLGGGQDKGGEGAGHPARAEEVDGEPGEHLHGQDVAQQESEEGGLGLKQLHVLSCLAQGSEVLNQLGLPRPSGRSAMEAALPSPSPPGLSPGAPNSEPRCSHSQCQAQGVQPKRWRGESTGVGSELGSQLVAGAHPARGVGTQEAEKGRAGKTLRAQCFKTLSVDGDAGPRAGRGLPSARREMEHGKCRPSQTRALGSCGPPTALPSAAAREGKANPAQDPGPPWSNVDGVATGDAPHPSRPPHWGLSLHQGPAHILGSILAGLLRGQLSNQQGLQELAHEIEVLVEGVEGILKESRRSGGRRGR